MCCLQFEETIPSADSQLLFIKMELCKSSLKHRLYDSKKSDHRSLDKSKKWFKHIAKGVKHIHDKDFIHRDLKPCNILFNKDRRLKIADMGTLIERKFGNDKVEILVNDDETIGTFVYKSPEQVSWDPKISSKSEVFTMGLIFVEMYVIIEKTEREQIFNSYRAGTQHDHFKDEPETATFVGKLTNKINDKRPSCSEILRDRFLR
ncbi:hypothetical protein PENTCL1PPCAC_8829 [Pristionchus entomophagus]|uniref:Protein kinase domain-containing protein n=1 Tax=Pristionchus entomophagus TaxID=358040 RepID=A0AAV5SZA5_9BILA|nr:hypothetical protein PENTCL1PPCAC_8829 [Pristionchus entomophagus]